MKINYDMSNNFNKMYNEANGVVFNKKKILKNDKIKIHSFTTSSILLFLKIEIPLILFLIIGIQLYFIEFISLIILKFILEISINLMLIGVLFFMGCILCYFFYTHSKKIGRINSRKGILEINKNGIVDKGENGFGVMFSFDNIEFIVITRNLIVFITNIPLIIQIPNINKEEIVNNIKKYSQVKIIDRSI